MAENEPSNDPADPAIPSIAQITLALAAVERGDARATDHLLKLVYDDLRQLAHARLSRRSPAAARE